MNKTEFEAALIPADNLHELVLQSESLLEASDIFFGHGTDNALDEAAYLVSYSMGLAPDFGEQDLQRQATAEQKQQLADLLWQRISTRKPAAYLTHEAWFTGLKFYVDERVLIPRSPFAELIADQFEPWVDASKVQCALDLCTGGGCIAIAMAEALPQARIDASDVSAGALAVARINVDQYELVDRVELIESDLFAGLGGRRYDLIVSNPPYVDAGDMAALPEEYRHEPAMGLAAGIEGLDFVLPMLREAPQHLNPGGVLIVEVGNSAEALAELLPEVPFTWLEFEFGGHGVFLLTAEQLNEASEAVRAAV
ncbi:50S ribosomal protein L3 N(5)-glutamine methyltransferase [Thiohalophilus sp.]|uniref:50S ribosomal protein L3 N(5)-glutamine methyltransferase n=1 Tax=Thiohalophilus sp. TaxID=3028392 RepID=UPI003975B1D0